MLRLMIVDDELLILNGLKQMIRQENTLFTEIETAADAYEALERLALFKPHLIITDIQMPGMDGLAFIQEARRRGAERFVILTGYDEFEYAREALRLHVGDYLLKPIQQKELFAMLNRTALDIMKERQNVQRRPEGGTDGRPEPDVQEQENANIRKFRIYINEHFMEDISLDDVAAAMELSPNYVCDILKKNTGQTFIQYLHEVRIRRAVELMQASQAPTNEHISRSVGFYSPRHFYKVFKQITGRTPGSYREKLAKKSGRG